MIPILKKLSHNKEEEKYLKLCDLFNANTTLIQKLDRYNIRPGNFRLVLLTSVNAKNLSKYYPAM